jgi:hypothetical protein
MGQSYRIRTELGINQSINVELNQDYEFLEILSLKIQQSDIYTSSCSEYGVIVGRVTANNGFGIPNAKVAVFIPVSAIDLENDLISSVYPYRTPTDKNEDGYRFNLLPYEKSYSKHAATGTFPSKNDALTNSTVIEIVDKYYKFTVKTNDSGDYMIMGVPLGVQTMVMDVDLSDIGEFSLTPQDLIRIGRATEAQVSGNQFRSSSDLNSLPQIVSISKILDVAPLWGDPLVCQIAINRVDFDLRDDANIDIQPTSVFMGSVYSTENKFRVRKNCKPKDNMGNLCSLISGPGQILAIRQTIREDAEGNPILEQYRLEQSGNVIDENGTWLIELPMNLDYIVTDEFGNKVVSPDPNVGIPTKGKYRFKIKWQQSTELTSQVRRPHYLLPNIREYGWSGNTDPVLLSQNSPGYKQQQSSYYFGLDWSGYTDGLTVTDANNKIDSIVNCEDTFYEFKFNKVYTVAGLIDQFKQGARGRFIGIKEIDDDSCASTVNKFPVNEGFKNFDLLYFIFSLLFQIIQFVGLAFLYVAHFTVGLIYQIINGIRILTFRKPKKGGIPIRLPMITYPDCEACECQPTTTDGLGVVISSEGQLSQLSDPNRYYQAWYSKLIDVAGADTGNSQAIADIYSQATGGNIDSTDPTVYKLLYSNVQEGEDDKFRAYSNDLPFGERINIFNSRVSYFSNLNRVKVSFAVDHSNNTATHHLDNTITVLVSNPFETGTILTTVTPENSVDPNFNFIGEDETFGISGNTILGPTSVNVRYANPGNQLQEFTTIYNLPIGSTVDNYAYPSDREYFQVITAITVSDYFKLTGQTQTPQYQTFPKILDSTITIFPEIKDIQGWRTFKSAAFARTPVKLRELYEEFNNQYVLILQRGVDPYSPRYTNRYNLGVLFGSTIDDPKYVVTASTKLNIPIQKLNSPNSSLQAFSQNDMFYNSYFFTPGLQYSAFTSNEVYYYGFTFYNFTNQSFFGARGVASSSSLDGFLPNPQYSISPTPTKYDSSEDLNGMSYYYSTGIGRDSIHNYFSYVPYYFNPTLPPFQFSDRTKNVMRTDRLPSSDQLDGAGTNSTAFLLQQNRAFTFYEVPDEGEGVLVPSYTTGFEQVPPDVEDLPDVNVLSSFDCENMVQLNCYTGYSNNFGVSSNCLENDSVERGCYVFFTRPLFGLGRDIRLFSEWGYRFRFFYALCRGVLSQTFTNNWVNGSLYMFPIQVDTTYNKQNKPNSPKFCKEIVYFENKTNNFYFRSSPYNYKTQKFVGKIPSDPQTSVNNRNLLFPTTIIDLGYKDSLYGEITLDPSADGYIMGDLNPTSYSDTSDIVNFFVISRIINSTFLSRLVGNSSINELFTRNKAVDRNRRVDGDLVQLLSINSEEGLIKFSPEFYTPTSGQENPLGYYGTSSSPTIGIFFSSTTSELQFKDYISPGRINFRATPTSTATPLQYGIKSQEVPFYPWSLINNSQIFGTELNNWATTTNDIYQKKYQSLDRVSDTDYFKAKGIVNDISMRGYIFNVNGDTIYDYTFDYKPEGPAFKNKFVVGAPFHFYFGTVVGATALDKFKTKYSVDE